MALTKCKECGHEVSDKASTCPNCGCPIEKGLVCNECGTSLSCEDKICPNCGNPIKEENGISDATNLTIESVALKEYSSMPQRHTWKVVCGIIALAAIVFGGFYLYKDSQEKTRLEYEAMQKAKADSARVADMDERAAAAEQARQDSIKAAEQEAKRIEELQRFEEERQRRLEEEKRLEEERQAEVQRQQEREIKSWIEGNWRYRAEFYGSIMETRVGISGDYIVVMMDGQHYYSGTYSIEGDHLVYNRKNGTADYLIIDKYNHRLMADKTHPMQRF